MEGMVKGTYRVSVVTRNKVKMDPKARNRREREGGRILDGGCLSADRKSVIVYAIFACALFFCGTSSADGQESF